MPTLPLKDWLHKEKALYDFIIEIETNCCAKNTHGIYAIEEKSIPEEEAIGILIKKYATLEEQLPQASAELAEIVDKKTLAQYHARNIEVKQAFWRCTTIVDFKTIFDATVNDIQRLNNLLKQITANTQRYLNELPQTATADKITGNAVILNTLLTGAINIAADTAFGPLGPCVASFSLAILEHAITYYLAAPKDPTQIMLCRLDPDHFIKLFKDCHGDTALAFRALENLNRKLSSGTLRWYNAAQWGLAAALSESIVRASSSTSFLGEAVKWAGSFFIPRYAAKPITPPSFEDIVATTLPPSPAG